MTQATSVVAPRNSPCPCGSGRRYKHCHGAVGSGVEIDRRSQYRPDGPDWDHLPEAKRDACGEKMEKALQLQTIGRDSDAERLYREVLNIAPQTHDALHMLGVIELGRGDLIEAERCIRDAMALRQEYVAIKKNLALVEDAINARQQHDVRIISELALPLLADEVLGRTTRENDEPPVVGVGGAQPVREGEARIHLVSDFGDPAGEREWYARRVATLLSARSPVLWSTQEPINFPPDSRHIRRISAVDRQVPTGGIQILVGIDCDLDAWVEQAVPERLLVFGLAASPALYLEQLRHLAASGAAPVELVFRSRAEARKFGRTGPVLVPPIELAAKSASIDAPGQSSSRTFTLGTVVRDQRVVRAEDDADLLKALAGTCRLSVLAPGRMRFALGRNRSLEFHSERELPLQAFLARIDALLHRVPDPWDEGCGLALFGAMARGLPVLCPRDSLFAEYIDHERSGLLYSHDSEIVPWVQRLGSDVEWAGAIGDGARAHAAELFDAIALQRGYNALVERTPNPVPASPT
jgi:glycosyltransferase involved in cell wall biosynthesis